MKNDHCSHVLCLPWEERQHFRVTKHKYTFSVESLRVCPGPCQLSHLRNRTQTEATQFDCSRITLTVCLEILKSSCFTTSINIKEKELDQLSDNLKAVSKAHFAEMEILIKPGMQESIIVFPKPQRNFLPLVPMPWWIRAIFTTGLQ